MCVRGRHLESHDLDSKTRKKILKKIIICTNVICEKLWHPRSINTLLCSLFKLGTNTWYSLPLINIWMLLYITWRRILRCIFLLSSSFGFSHQGSPQRIFLLQLFLSTVSSCVTSTSAMSSFTTSINLLFWPSPFPLSWQVHPQHPSPNIPIIFPP